MSILPRLRIQQVAVLAASDGFTQVAEVSFVSVLFLWISLVVRLCALVGKAGAVCGDLSLIEVIK